jgi:hypothetical protein
MRNIDKVGENDRLETLHSVLWMRRVRIKKREIIF